MRHVTMAERAPAGALSISGKATGQKVKGMQCTKGQVLIVLQPQAASRPAKTEEKQGGRQGTGAGGRWARTGRSLARLVCKSHAMVLVCKGFGSFGSCPALPCGKGFAVVKHGRWHPGSSPRVSLGCPSFQSAQRPGLSSLAGTRGPFRLVRRRGHSPPQAHPGDPPPSAPFPTLPPGQGLQSAQARRAFSQE